MKIFRKNQLVITALAALIAVAGYLNHIEKSEQKGTLAGAKITKETESTVQPETQQETQEAQQAAGTDIESNEIDTSGFSTFGFSIISSSSISVLLTPAAPLSAEIMPSFTASGSRSCT